MRRSGEQIKSRRGWARACARLGREEEDTIDTAGVGLMVSFGLVAHTCARTTTSNECPGQFAAEKRAVEEEGATDLFSALWPGWRDDAGERVLRRDVATTRRRVSKQTACGREGGSGSGSS